jgi:hypothetical protein
MPFAGDADGAHAAVVVLRELEVLPGDQLILADNSGTASATDGVSVIAVAGERSPAHARNVGAEAAVNEWILFLDSDCLAPSELLDEYFAAPVAGEVSPLADGSTLAARYGLARSFLSQEAHLRHPYRPRAVAANLLVRREAFAAIGGFQEGVRAAEDTDFSWRLQQAGWRLELRPGAGVEHRYRTTLGELRRQWRGYAAGRAWLSRRYQDFEPQPAIRRALARAAPWGRRPRGAGGTRQRAAPATRAGALERGRFLAIDVLLSAEELAGLVLSNRPPATHRAPAGVVLIADRFPVHGDPLAEFARTLEHARIEAVARPAVPDLNTARGLAIDYREDDGAGARMLALVRFAVRHPLRTIIDAVIRGRGEPSLLAIAPAIRRLERDRDARVRALGAGEPRSSALRLARLTNREFDGG